MCANNNALLARLGEKDDALGAFSPDFSKGTTLTVSSSVTFGETEDQARAAIADLSAASFSGCFSQAYAAAVRRVASTTNATATTTKLPALTVGDQSIGYRTVVKFRFEGQSVTLNADFTFVRFGRGFAEFDAQSEAAPFAEAERVRLVTTLVGRLAAP